MNGYFVIVESVGGKNNLNIVPEEIVYLTKEKWNSIKDNVLALELFKNNKSMLDGVKEIEQIKKNRVIRASWSTSANSSILYFPRSSIDIKPQNQY